MDEANLAGVQPQFGSASEPLPHEGTSRTVVDRFGEALNIFIYWCRILSD